jgi:tape measure domain-containing protein
MAKSTNELELILQLQADQFAREMGTVNRQLEKLNKTAEDTKKKSSGVFTGFLGAGLALKGIDAIASGITSIGSSMIKGAADIETYKTSFATMLGSMDQANVLMEDLKTLGAETPFEFPELAQSAKNLLSFGFGQDEIIEKMRMIGDVASGVGVPVGELAAIYGKAKMGHLIQGDDLNQLAEKGIPVYEEFAQQLGVGTDQIRKLASEGKITFPMLETAFQNLTGEGGKFNGMMEAQSKTFAGMLSTMKDNVGSMLTAIGGPIIEGLKEPMAAMIKMFENPALQESITKLGTAIGGILSEAMEILLPIIEEITPILSEIIESILVILDPVAELAKILLESLSPIIKIVVDVFKQMAPIIAKVVGVVGQLLVSLQPLIDEILAVVVERIDIFMPLLEALVELLTALSPVIALAAKAIGGLAVGFHKLLNGALKPVIGLLTDIVETIADAINGLTSFFGLVAQVPDYKKKDEPPKKTEKEKQDMAVDNAIAGAKQALNLQKEQNLSLEQEKQILAQLIKDKEVYVAQSKDQKTTADDFNRAIKQQQSIIDQMSKPKTGATKPVGATSKDDLVKRTKEFIDAQKNLVEDDQLSTDQMLANLNERLAGIKGNSASQIEARVALKNAIRDINKQILDNEKAIQDQIREQEEKNIQKDKDDAKRVIDLRWKAVDEKTAALERERQDYADFIAELDKLRAENLISQQEYESYAQQYMLRHVTKMDEIANKQTEDQRKREEEQKAIIQDRQDTMSMVADYSKQLGAAIGGMFAGGEDSAKEALKSILNIVITAVEGMIMAASAAALAKGVLSWGFSTLTDIPLIAAAMAGLEIVRGVVNSMDVGTPYVPEDQMAKVHKGEMIVPKSFNEALMSGQISISGRTDKKKDNKVKVDMYVSNFQNAQRYSEYAVERVRL